MEPPISPLPTVMTFFFLELSFFFFFFLDWAGLDIFFCGATRQPFPGEFLSPETRFAAFGLSAVDLGGQRLGGLGREGALQYPDKGQENPNSDSGLPFPPERREAVVKSTLDNMGGPS